MLNLRALGARLRTRGRRDATPTVEVVIGTRSVDVYHALAEASARTNIGFAAREAGTTNGVYQQLEGAHLVILDTEGPHAIPVKPGKDGMAYDAVRAALQQHAMVSCTAREFQQDPDAYLRQAVSFTGLIQYLPPRVVCFIQYSGGVGKTTGALDLLLTFRRATGHPAGGVEFCYGASAFHTFADRTLPTMFEVVNQARIKTDPSTGKRIVPPVSHGAFNGVSLVPMIQSRVSALDHEDVRDWFTGSEQFEGFIRQHVLTVLDVHEPHDIYKAARIGALVDHFFVPFDARRPDTARQAEAMALELRTEYPAARVEVVRNMQGRDLQQVLGGVECDFGLPLSADAEFLHGTLGAIYLTRIYPFARLTGTGNHRV